MIIRVLAMADRASVDEGANLRELAVEVPDGLPDADVERALTGLGTLSGDVVWLDIDELRRRAGETQPRAWRHDFDAMIEFAAGRGWVDADGRAVRAHLQRTSPER